jgi:integrase
MRGIRRSLGTARVKKTPATVERILAMAPIASEHLADIRDRALLLFGFASAMRRSELASLDVEDLEDTPDGLRVRSAAARPTRRGMATSSLCRAGRSPVRCCAQGLD